MSEAQLILGEILDHFLTNDLRPEDAWAFPDDGSSLCLDHQSPDGAKFWLDLKRDGTITVLWRPAGADKPRVLHFKCA
jgi:hypothetical protein